MYNTFRHYDVATQTEVNLTERYSRGNTDEPLYYFKRTVINTLQLKEFVDCLKEYDFTENNSLEEHIKR